MAYRFPLDYPCKRVLVCALLWAFTVSARSAPCAPTTDVSPAAPGITRCVQQALAAINTHSPEAVAALATPDAAESFAWVRATTTRLWSAGVLKTPDSEGGKAKQESGEQQHTSSSRSGKATHPVYLAVFYAWHTCQSDGDHVHLLTLTPRGWRLGPEIPETETGGFRVRDHDLHVAIDAPRQIAMFSDRARIERMGPESFPYCLLRLSEVYHVQALTCDGRAVPFQQTGGVLVFAPPANKTFTVGLRYSGTANHSDGDYIRTDEATLNAYWYPHIARLPATATIMVTAPVGWTPVAQGEPLRQRRGADGAITVTYRNDLPVCWFTVDMGRYHITTRRVDGRKLTAYLLRNDPTFAGRCLDVLARALRFYDSRFARFPYTRYGLVETHGNLGGALEAYSFATFSAREMLDNIPHELAHTWWGGLVPCTYTGSMWDESFADYSDYLFHRMTSGETARVTTITPHVAYGNHFKEFSLAEACDTSDGRQASVGYDKGSLVLRVLEEELGRDALQRCISAFVADHPRGEAAEWPEFEQAVNRVMGNDYHWFFAQWLERKGLPTARLDKLAVKRDDRGYLIVGDIVQTGTPYRLRVPLLLRTAEGGFMRQDVEISSAEAHFELHADSAPQRLTLDPDNVLPLASAEGTTCDLTDLTLRGE